jgi:hypothetical protein
MRRLALLVLVAAAPACSPSIDPAAKADLDRQLGGLTISYQIYAYPRTFLPMAFGLGQWTQYRMLDERGQPSLLTYKLVGEENDATWIETVTENYTGRHVMKMLVEQLGGRSPALMQIRAVKVKEGKQPVREIDPNVLPVVQAVYRAALSTLTLGWEGKPQENVQVPAGSFAGCYKVQSDVAWGPWQAASVSWSHPAVPLSGVVRSRRLDGRGMLELVNFGETGAQSDL